jgi:hypothetical protein
MYLRSSGEEEVVMLRAILCVTLGLFLCADVALAKGGQKTSVSGKISKVDADTGTLSMTVKSKTDSSNKDFTVTDSVRVVIIAEDGTTTEKTGKEGLKHPAVKVGAHVKVTTDASGAVTKIRVGKKPGTKKS